MVLARIRSAWWRFRGKELCCGHTFNEHWSNGVCSLCDCPNGYALEIQQMSEAEKVEECQRLIDDGLSVSEAQGTVWPEPAPLSSRPWWRS